MTQLPLIMQCTHKGSMVRAQYCSEWTGLGYGMARLFDSFVPRWLIQTQPLLCIGFGQAGQGPELCEFTTLLKFSLLIGFWKSDTSGSQLKVPFAVTYHKFIMHNLQIGVWKRWFFVLCCFFLIWPVQGSNLMWKSVNYLGLFSWRKIELFGFFFWKSMFMHVYVHQHIWMALSVTYLDKADGVATLQSLRYKPLLSLYDVSRAAINDVIAPSSRLLLRSVRKMRLLFIGFEWRSQWMKFLWGTIVLTQRLKWRQYILLFCFMYFI